MRELLPLLTRLLDIFWTKRVVCWWGNFLRSFVDKTVTVFFLSDAELFIVSKWSLLVSSCMVKEVIVESINFFCFLRVFGLIRLNHCKLLRRRLFTRQFLRLSGIRWSAWRHQWCPISYALLKSSLNLSILDVTLLIIVGWEIIILLPILLICWHRLPFDVFLFGWIHLW